MTSDRIPGTPEPRVTEDDYFSWRAVDHDTYRHYRVPAYLLEVLKNRNASVLDFGCGFGHLLSGLRELGFVRLEGADINAKALSRGRSLGFVIHDPNDEDFYEKHAGRFDFVIVSHVLEHIPKDMIIPQLKRLRALLTEGGSLFTMVPNAQSNTGSYWAYEDFTHHTIFTSGSLFYVLRAAGFSQVTFVDIDCTAGQKAIKRMARRVLLAVYRRKLAFWNRVTVSAFHAPSPQIFSYEIKALARK